MYITCTNCHTNITPYRQYLYSTYDVTRWFEPGVSMILVLSMIDLPPFC